MQLEPPRDAKSQEQLLAIVSHSILEQKQVPVAWRHNRFEVPMVAALHSETGCTALVADSQLQAPMPIVAPSQTFVGGELPW